VMFELNVKQSQSIGVPTWYLSNL